MHISILQEGINHNSEASLQFPQFAIKQRIPEYIEKAKTQGRNKAIKAFWHYIQQNISV